MFRSMIRMVVVLGALVVLGACGSGVGNEGVIVGGDCVVSRECDVDSRCLTGEDFPGGYCARSCDSDDQCPEGSACVDEAGGVCMVSCASSGECRSEEGYDCVELTARGAGGTATVCATP
jgi:hypothetical protein